MKDYKLRMNGVSYMQFRQHLFPGDEKESIAFALCGKYENDSEEIYTVHKIELYPNDKCVIRKHDRVQWSPPDVVHLFEECRKRNMFLLKIHCHPGYWPYFSDTDDESDIRLGDTITGWTGRDDKIISVIMLPDGHLFGRVVDADGRFLSLSSILVVGDDIQRFTPPQEKKVDADTDVQFDKDDIQLRTKQAFGEGTANTLRDLRIGVVGCSGTGSIVAELLGRLGVGHIVLVDPDIVEYKNLNRILNTTAEDAKQKRSKVFVLKSAIEAIGTGGKVTAMQKNLYSTEAYNMIASCDVVFGCMDSIDGRHLLNRIGTYFCLAYFDVGIRLDADGKGGISDILGRVDYLQPGGSSLLSRERYTVEQLRAADMARTNPDEYVRQVSEKYIKSANVESPAVISVNMMFSSQAVTELLARLHPFRDMDNCRYASIDYSIGGGFLVPKRDGEVDHELQNKVGLGEVLPTLGSPMLILDSN